MKKKQISTGCRLCAAIALMLLFGWQAVQLVSASTTGNQVYLPLVIRGCSGPCPYYVSSSQGADGNSGLDSAHPFKSIAKVNSLNLAPGSKILFKCGDVWRGEMLVLSKSGSAGAPLTYSSYPAGCSDQPRLDGTQPVTGWTTYAAHIYVADLNAGANLAAFRSPDGKTNYAINQLFRGGQRLGMGRWPNLDAGDGGYATLSAQPAGNQITSSVSLPAGNWSGATLHLKVMRWSMVNRDVSAQNGSTLTLNEAVTCPYTSNCSGWGFFINNSLNTLDRDGEWAYDKVARKVYLYSSTDPNGAGMEASPLYKSDGRSWGAVNLGVDSAAAVHDVVVDNFAIRGWFASGIVSPTNLHPDENSGLTLSNNHLSDLDDTGISLWSWVWGASDGKDGWRGGNNILIQGNLIDGANHFGIHTPSRLTTIDHNTIRNIGVIANLNESGLGCGKTGDEGHCTEDGAGLRIYVDRPDRSGYGFTVQYNRFENIAYNGIQMFGGSSTFANNVFIYTCMAKGDGGAINTFGSGNMGSSNVHDIQILNNIILYTIGNTDGANSKYRDLFGFGVYLDQASLNVTTCGNTIAYSTAAGILYQMANGVVENNTLFDNVSGAMWSDQVHLTASPAALSAFNGNIMVANNDHSRNLGLTSTAQISAADNNRYYHTLNAGMQVNLNNASQSLAQWQAVSGKDAHAKSGTTAFAATLQLYVNDGAASKTITAPGGSFNDLDGNPLGTSFVLGRIPAGWSLISPEQSYRGFIFELCSKINPLFLHFGRESRHGQYVIMAAANDEITMIGKSHMSVKKGRVFSGARPTGRQHLGNYLGAIQNYVALQDEYDCIYCIVDLHALTTLDTTLDLRNNVYEMALDWLAAGIRPDDAIMFIQSQVPQVTELHTILSMVTPLGKLTDLPTFKEKVRQSPDNINYGLVGYPVLMSADIALYKAGLVPVGVDQGPHIEFARETVRSFNYHFNTKCLIEPQMKVTQVPKVIGLDGVQKMSKSLNNHIELASTPQETQQRVMTMVTDPARMRRTDPGNPDICNVFSMHKIFSTGEEVEMVNVECRRAGIGCVDCKKLMAKNLNASLEPFRARRMEIAEKPDAVWSILADGARRAEVIAEQTMVEVREAIGLPKKI